MSKVMVVDDALTDVKLMESILMAAGHQVVCYTDGLRLEEKVVLENPDVLLLDIVMPQRNGYDILRGLRRDDRTKHMPVIVVTSRSQESDRIWGRRQGADEYLTKPFSADQLVGAVRRFVP